MTRTIKTTARPRVRRRGLEFRPAASNARTGGQYPPSRAPVSEGDGCGGGRRCVTPRQACPRPDGLGRNLRSKTRWFTGFCNSHQVSHFATFFIDARAEISVAESRYCKYDRIREPRVARGRDFPFVFLGVIHAGVRLCAAEITAPRRSRGGTTRRPRSRGGCAEPLRGSRPATAASRCE